MSNATVGSEVAFRALSVEHLKASVPSIFTQEAAPRTSDHYTFLSTIDVVNNLNELGWFPVHACEMKVKSEDRKGYQKHIIRFRHRDFWIGDDIDHIESIPELVCTNSHDGRSAFNFYSGLHRFVCSNGLIMSTVDFSNLYIRHRNFDFDDLVQVARGMAKQVPAIMYKIDLMKRINMSASEQRYFAQEVVRARWDYNYIPDYKDMLTAIREEDEGDNLWVIFNRLQEKLTKGGFIGMGHRKIKKLTDANRELNVNRKLYKILKEYLAEFTITQ